MIVVPKTALDKYPVSTMKNGIAKRMGKSQPLFQGRRKSIQGVYGF
jgi:hypothetical protein